MNIKPILLMLMLVLPMMVTAQREREVSGEYTYYVPSNVTLEQAKITAEQHARIAALVKEFNIMVYQNNTSVLSNRNGDEIDDFYSVDVTESRGEWIRNTKPTEFELIPEEGNLVVKATVWGMAREVMSAKTSIDARVLRNGTEPKYESNLFKEGDDLYLYFRSAEDGWLCVFLFNRFNNEVNCLLPYLQSPEGSVRVKHDKEYVFFKADQNLPDWNLIDEYTMTCESSAEFNEIYVVFSPHKFSKPVGGDTDLADKPLSFDAAALTRWLSKCQSKDKDMVVEKRLVRVEK